MGYVAPAVAAVMTCATGVRHIYLIIMIIFQGVWNVEGAEVALGAESVDRNFKASQLMATEESILLHNFHDKAT